MVKNMHGFYRTFAFGVFILLYAAVVLVIKTYDIAIRLLPMRVKIPVVNGPLQRTASTVIASEEGSENRNRGFLMTWLY